MFKRVESTVERNVDKEGCSQRLPVVTTNKIAKVRQICLASK